MPRKPSLIRVTSVGSALNSGWKEYWYKGLENGNKDTRGSGLVDILSRSCVEFAKSSPSADQWRELLTKFSPLREADRISKESKEFGTAVHKVVENYLLGVKTPEGTQPGVPTARQLTCGNLLIDWCKQTCVVPLELEGKPAIECELKDEELGLVGHPDLICTFGDDKTAWIIDWKTSKDNRDEYVIQMALYSELIYRQYGLNINNGAVIRTPSDPTVTPQFEDHPYCGLRERYRDLALEALNVFKFFNNKGVWRE